MFGIWTILWYQMSPFLNGNSRYKSYYFLLDVFLERKFWIKVLSSDSRDHTLVLFWTHLYPTMVLLTVNFEIFFDECFLDANTSTCKLKSAFCNFLNKIFWFQGIFSVFSISFNLWPLQYLFMVLLTRKNKPMINFFLIYECLLESKFWIKVLSHQ